jgi:hypothetical protein
MAFSFNQAPSGASPIKTPSAGNYLDFQSATGANFAQQYMPELYEAEVERYGNRTLSGFLSMVGAEESMTSDQVVWSEQNRLHISYTGASAAGDVVTLPAGHVLVPNMTVVVKGSVGVVKAIVIGVAGADVTLGSYNTTGTIQAGAGASVDLFVYGSEFAKGTAGSTSNITPDFTSFSNTPIIIKDKYAINGSDTAQIGWVEVADESGTSGYLWYLKAEGETRLRFQDYLEMAMVEGEKAITNSAALGAGNKGTEGLFAAIESRGNVANEFGGNLPEFDEILKGLDKEGAIEENMLFINRQTSLDFDDMLAAVNSDYQGGTSYGVFNNEADMALNLGFSGFRRGSYDFYKTDWKYLNDSTTRGLVNDVDGVIIPAGTSSVYDQNLGSNIRRPFLHVRYRSSQADDRRLKSWITGSVGAATSDVDEMAVHFLSERCLCVQGANNFVLLKA